MLRTAAVQNEHDNALARIAKARFSSTQYVVVTNPNSQKNAGIKYTGKDGKPYEVFPDIVVRNRDDGKINTLGEVETADSVTDAEAKQWRTYSLLTANFVLYVPLGSEAAAKTLMASNGVKGKLRRFYMKNGNFVVDEVG